MRASYITLSIFLLAALSYAAYNENFARELVGPAGISYCKQSDQLALTCGPHCEKMKANGYKTLFAELLPNGPVTAEAFSIFYKAPTNQVIVSFRGTNSNLQLMAEFLGGIGAVYDLQPGFPEFRVLSYFYNKYKNTIRSTLFKDLNIVKAKYPTASYVITGHSLGGALATLASFDLSKSGMIPKSKMQLYNFGSPRVGNYEFVTALMKEGFPIYRIVNSRDPVPHVPPCLGETTGITGKCSKAPQGNSNLWRPYHIDQEVFYPDNTMRPGQYKICSDEDLKCSLGVSVVKYEVNTHLWYFGERIGCQI